MRTPVTVSTGRGADGQLVVLATGELDMSNIDAFNRALADALTQAAGGPVQVDLRGVEYLDSGALNTLFAHADRVHVLANPIVMPVLTVSGLTGVTRVDAGGQ